MWWCRQLCVFPRMAHVTPLLCKLHWLLVCFLVQLKMLALTSKIPQAWTQVTWGTDFPQLHISVPSGLVGEACYGYCGYCLLRRKAFSALAPVLWNVNLPEVILAPILLAFMKSLFSSTGDPKEMGILWASYTVYQMLIHFSHVVILICI